MDSKYLCNFKGICRDNMQNKHKGKIYCLADYECSKKVLADFHP